jgi:hypothetical protein
VGECLGEVAERFARRADLLRIEPEVVRVAQHLLEDEAGLLETSRARQGLDQPEGAHGEGPLVAVEAVRRGGHVVAVDEAAAGEVALDGV